MSKKKYKKNSCFWSGHFFEDVLLLAISRNYLEIPSLDNIFLGDSTLSNSIALVEGLRRWHRSFEIFLIDRFDGKIGNKNIAGKY